MKSTVLASQTSNKSKDVSLLPQRIPEREIQTAPIDRQRLH